MSDHRSKWQLGKRWRSEERAERCLCVHAVVVKLSASRSFTHEQFDVRKSEPELQSKLTQISKSRAGNMYRHGTHTQTMRLITHRRRSLRAYREVPTWIHLVADHFSPLSVGHEPCSDEGSSVPSGCSEKNRSASPLVALTDKPADARDVAYSAAFATHAPLADV